MPFTIDDTFVEKFLRPFAPVAFLLLAVPGIVAGLIVFSTDYFRGGEPGWVVSIINISNSLQGVPASTIKTLTQICPALVTALCFRSDKQLNKAGQLSVVILVLSLVASAFALFVIDPQSTFQFQNVTGGQVTLQRLSTAADATLSLGITYLALLIGLKLQVQ